MSDQFTAATIVHPVKQYNPKIYAYALPQVPERVGWLKIGMTERGPEQRIKEQIRTAALNPTIVWHRKALYLDDDHDTPFFTDHDFFQYLKANNIERLNDGDSKEEWFHFGDTLQEAKKKSMDLFLQFVNGTVEDTISTTGEYQLRPEQQQAVQQTSSYFNTHDDATFLWNAKPRFGKTLTAYDLVLKQEYQNVLVITQRPVIAQSWLDDYLKFVQPNSKLKFVTESNSLKKSKGCMSYAQYAREHKSDETIGMIAFDSLQNVKGSQYFGGPYDKLEWMKNQEWDLLIIDEAHEGTETELTQQVFDNLSFNHQLRLSGTPFKMVESGDFNDGQIFNWSYADEQAAKAAWDESNPGTNPHGDMPRLNMLTYRMSQDAVDAVNAGMINDQEQYSSYGFDLNEFFRTQSNGRFVYESQVIKFIDMMTKNGEYPFSSPGLREKLPHTLWLLSRVSSVKALAQLLNENPVFSKYDVITAVGDVKDSDLEALDEDESVSDNKQTKYDNNLAKVRDSIKNNDRTITLSVGQLTTGVTIPEWCGVMMLSDIKSASLYMQAAFRVQNPWTATLTVDGKSGVYRKTDAYVFDFSPARTLSMYEKMATGLTVGYSTNPKQQIQDVLNFFPVLGMDDNGGMMDLDAEEILSIPRKYKVQNAIETGFMTNDLLNEAVIKNIYRSRPDGLLDSINKLPEEVNMTEAKAPAKVVTPSIDVDDKNEPVSNKERILSTTDAVLSELKYEKTIVEDVDTDIPKYTDDAVVNRDYKEEQVSTHIHEQTETLKPQLLDQISDKYDLPKSKLNKMLESKLKEQENQINRSVRKLGGNYDRELNRIKASDLSDDEKIEQLVQAETTYDERTADVTAQFAKNGTQEIITNVEKQINKNKMNEELNTIRAKLRGFLRTIPMLMAGFGTRETTLRNFDDDIDDVLFEETTGITNQEFHNLRDGYDYVEDGEEKHFEGNPFDEQVFNGAIQGFLDELEKRERYFEMDLDDTIFKYIPAQKTTLKYVPLKTANLMLDEFDKLNPGIFDNSAKTYFDGYTKSGLFLMGIARRLYVSPVLISQFPVGDNRIKHILENQIYSCVPSAAGYMVIKRLLFGFDHDNIIDQSHIIHLDMGKELSNRAS